MTLDEAIEKENKIAEENQKIVDTQIVFDDVSISGLYCDDTEVIEEHLSNYKKCAEYHDQISEWLEELKAYRAIGTPEECRAAVEKQTAAKPLGGKDADGNDYAICRECSAILSDGEWFAQYCPDCGKKVDWSDENEQRT